jgi:hypothetical protein
MDLDLSMLWSWITPLWGIVLLAFFMVGTLFQPVALAPYPDTVYRGGARRNQAHH